MDWEWVCVYKKCKLLCVIISLIICNTCSAQIDLELDQQVENEEIIINNFDQYEEIITKYKNKLSLLEFIRDKEFNALFLSEKQVLAIEKHIEHTGKVIDLLELQTIEGIDEHIYAILIKFIRNDQDIELENKKTLKALSRTQYHSETEKNVIGNNWANYQQIKYSINSVYSVGFSREFDVGENNSKHLLLNKYDHYAFYLHRNTRKNELSIGNYQLFHGFGLLVGQGFNAASGNAGIQNVIQHRWNPNANQTEYNFFQGVYFRKKLNNHSLNIGYSYQKIDAKNTFGSHNTLSELEQKNKLVEKLLLISFEKTHRKTRNSILLIPNAQLKQSSISLASQVLFGNTCIFSEFTVHNLRYAYTIGFTKLFSKDVQFSIANTKFGKNYLSAWASNTVQGFNLNDEHGIALNISFPFYKKWNVSLSHRVNFSAVKNENIIGKSIENTELIRVDKSFSKELKLSLLCLLKQESIDGKTTEKQLNENSIRRYRSSVKYQLNEHYAQEISLLLNEENRKFSKGIVYNTSLKFRKIKIIYSIALSDINDGIPIYANVQSIINTRNTISFFANGTNQNLGIQFKFKHIQVDWQLNNQYNSVERTSKSILIGSIKYL